MIMKTFQSRQTENPSRSWKSPEFATTVAPLVAGVREADTKPAVDDLLTQWREHLAHQPEARKDDTAAIINWPARDVTAVLALLRHGLQPMTVIAVRQAGRPLPTAGPKGPESPASKQPGLVIRPAEPADLDRVTELEMGAGPRRWSAPRRRRRWPNGPAGPG